MSSRAVSAEVSMGRSRTPAKHVGELLDQQAALRELAVAVAEMRAPEVIYELVAMEAAKVAGVDSGAVVRFRVDGVAEVVGSYRMSGSHIGSLLPLEGVADGVRRIGAEQGIEQRATAAVQRGELERMVVIGEAQGRLRTAAAELVQRRDRVIDHSPLPGQ